MSRRILPITLSVVLTLGAGATTLGAEPSVSPTVNGPSGVIGPGVETLAVTPGTVEVIAGAPVRMSPLDAAPSTRILAVIANGTDVPVDADVAWAASTPDGALAWTGQLGNSRSSFNGNLLSGSVPGAIPPGGLGLMLGGDDGLPEGIALDFAVRSQPADEPSSGEPAVDVAAATLEDGHLVGEVRDASEFPVERGISVLAVCLDQSGLPIAGAGVFFDVDQPIEPGGTAPFDIDLGDADCSRFLVGALGDS